MAKMFLAGGGEAEDSVEVDARFLEVLAGGRVLFLPQAVAPKIWGYGEAYDWVRKPKGFSGVDIQMWTDLEGHPDSELFSFGAIYVMGGNTFDLLSQLRQAHFLERIERFMGRGGLVYGLSAGAIILGHDISPARLGPEADENEVGLTDLSGLNVLMGWNVLTHYSGDQEAEAQRHANLHGAPLIGIPERAGVFVDGASCQALGPEPVTLFRQARKRVVQPYEAFALAAM